ncbi:hypothetical protein [Pedobacter nototheniae]|nr:MULTISPECIES: hypothetical protein [Pedobacter]
MALNRSKKLWILAIIYLILTVMLIDWLDSHFYGNKKHLIKQTDQYETKK